MSIKIMTLVFESALPTSPRITLLSMADYASETGESIYPSVETMMHRTGLKERTVREVLATLRSMELIEIVSRGGGRYKANHYRINIKKLQEFSDPFFFEKGAARAGNPAARAGNPAARAGKGASTAPNPSLSSSIRHDPPVGEKPEPIRVTIPELGDEGLPKERVSKISDSLSKHPAIKAVRAITKRYPPKELYNEIIAILGDHPDSVKLMLCWLELKRRGGNPNSWYWVTEWMVTGIPSYKKSPQIPMPIAKSQDPATTKQIADQLKEEKHNV